MREPLNIKLLLLYLAKRIYVLGIGILAGALIFGGGYYLKTYVFATPLYYATSQLYLTYIDNVKIDNIYINDYTWQTLADSDVCVEEALKELPSGMTPEYLRSVVKAGLESDVRLVTVTVTCENPDEAVQIANAYEKAIVKLKDRMADVTDVQVFTSATTAVKKGFDDRTLRMGLTGGLVGLVASLVALLFAFALDDSIYLPETTTLRYQIPTLLCIAKKNLDLTDWDAKAAKNNLDSLLEGKTKVCVTDVSAKEGCSVSDMQPLFEVIQKNTSYQGVLSATEGINQNADAINELRDSDGVILLLKAAGGNAKITERALDYLKIQNVNVLGFVLYGTDSKGMQKYLSYRK